MKEPPPFKVFFYTNFIRAVSRTTKTNDANAISDDKSYKTEKHSLSR